MTETQTWIEADFVVSGAGELTCARTGAQSGARSVLGTIPDGAVAARDGRIVWVGRTDELREGVRLLRGGQTFDAAGRVVMPGLVEIPRAWPSPATGPMNSSCGWRRKATRDSCGWWRHHELGARHPRAASSSAPRPFT